MGNKQVIHHIHGKSSPNTLTTDSIDEKIKYGKEITYTNTFLKGSCSRGLPAGPRGEQQKESGGVVQWAGADSRTTSGQVQSPLPLSGQAA